MLAALDDHIPRLYCTTVVWVVVLGGLFQSRDILIPHSVNTQRSDILIPHSVNVCSLSSLAQGKALEHRPSPLLPLIFVWDAKIS